VGKLESPLTFRLYKGAEGGAQLILPHSPAMYVRETLRVNPPRLGCRAIDYLQEPSCDRGKVPAIADEGAGLSPKLLACRRVRDQVFNRVLQLLWQAEAGRWNLVSPRFLRECRSVITTHDRWFAQERSLGA